MIINGKATSYAVRKSENGFSDMGPKIRFLCYQKKPFLIRHFLIKLSNSPIRRYFQHAHFIPIVSVGKRGEY